MLDRLMINEAASHGAASDRDGFARVSRAWRS